MPGPGRRSSHYTGRSPWPDEIRKSNGRDNLYAASVLAVNPDNGDMKWYVQMVPDDSWDYDSVQQLMLVDLNIKGRMRKVIMQANKDGFFYVVDRQNGGATASYNSDKLTLTADVNARRDGNNGHGGDVRANRGQWCVDFGDGGRGIHHARVSRRLGS